MLDGVHFAFVSVISCRTGDVLSANETKYKFRDATSGFADISLNKAACSER